MKRLALILLIMVLFLSACASNTAKTIENKELEVVKVASHTSPMTDILELIAPELEAKGFKLELVKVTDNVQANVALNNKEVDANFFQHEPFMAQFNKGNNANLVKVASVYNAIVSFYSKDLKNLSELKDGAVVAIPNDPTNLARALRLLSTAGLIELDSTSYDVTAENIKSNPKNLVFKEWGLLNLNEAYQESDLTFNYPTYIAKLELNPKEHGLAFENSNDQTFAISLVAREDNKEDMKVKALVEAVNSDTVKKFIEENLKGHAVVSFE